MPKDREIQDIDLVSAIWILASNDENPLITYRGLIHRLGLPPDFNIKATVASRRELFRPGARRPESMRGRTTCDKEDASRDG